MPTARCTAITPDVRAVEQTSLVADDPVRTATEQWFLSRGLPHFIAGYNAATEIWTRALPSLTLLVLIELAVLAPRRDFPIWLDLLATAGAFAALLGVWAFVNHRRGRRAMQRPDDLGPIEIAAFVIGPALVPIVTGRQYQQAFGVAVLNVALLGAIYLATSYGVISILRWAFHVLLRQLETVMSLVARALPLLTLLVTFLFLTNEVWQTAGALDGPVYWIAVLLFPTVGVLFLLVRLPRDVGELNNFGETHEFAELVAATPIAAVAEEPTDVPPPLSRREWSNVGLVTLISQGIQIALVSVLIGVFFVVLGLLLVDEATTKSWSGSANVYVSIAVGERNLVITEELLRVAGFLTAFSGLNFTVYLLTDETYRREFRDEVVRDLRQAFAVRAAYLAYVAGRARV
jgi:hypothetical protein